MFRPLIGITGSKVLGYDLAEPVGFADANFDLYASEYADSVAASGGLPIHLSPVGGVEIVDHISALVVSGGEDVDSRRYNEAPGPVAGPYNVQRDEFEFALVERAFERGIPILGVCRGHQLINVALGGSLVQDLPLGEGESHAAKAYYRKYRSHAITITTGTLLGKIYGEHLKVNSFHHQAIKEPGHGVVPVAWAEDGVIEAFEVPGKPVIGVQWHPETFGADPIFQWLVQEANKLVDLEHSFTHS